MNDSILIFRLKFSNNLFKNLRRHSLQRLKHTSKFFLFCFCDVCLERHYFRQFFVPEELTMRIVQSRQKAQEHSENSKKRKEKIVTWACCYQWWRICHYAYVCCNVPAQNCGLRAKLDWLYYCCFFRLLVIQNCGLRAKLDWLYCCFFRLLVIQDQVTGRVEQVRNS